MIIATSIIVLLPPAESHALDQLAAKYGCRAGAAASEIANRCLRQDLLKSLQALRDEHDRRVGLHLSRSHPPARVAVSNNSLVSEPKSK